MQKQLYTIAFFYPYVTVNEEITDQKDGPLSVIENSIEGGLRFLSMTSLDVKASNIELAFVREKKKTTTFEVSRN